MLNEIILTEYGEVLSCYPGTETRDDIDLDSCIGAHEVCEGWVDLRKVSKTHNAIVCRRCHLRIVVPSEVNTWKKLAGYFKQLGLVQKWTL